MKKALIPILAVLMLVPLAFLCACGSNNGGSTDSGGSADQGTSKEDSGYAVKYQLKINPSFVVFADEDLCVTELIAENAEAVSVMNAIDILGQPVANAFCMIKDEAQNQGFMSAEKGNTMNISILDKDDELMPTCHVCNGSGRIICLECNGTGICCSCEPCGGTGKLHYEAGQACPHCNGSGLCSECGGKGKIVVTNGENGAVVYASPGVPEMGPCPGCSGDGVCGNCHGGDYSKAASDEVCDGCKGSGVIYCQDDLNGYRWCPCCWGSGIEGTGDPDYAQWMQENGY